MLDLETLTVKDIKELKNLLGSNQNKNTTAKKIIDDGSIRICVLQRGWVVIGRFSQYGTECRLKNARVIRIWGTTKGLGELALNGPIQDKTVLDKCPDVVFHELVGVFQIICEKSKWENVLV